MLEVIEPVASKSVAKFTKQDVIELIQKMRSFNQREQAMVTYKRENERHPEWQLRAAFEAMKDAK